MIDLSIFTVQYLQNCKTRNMTSVVMVWHTQKLVGFGMVFIRKLQFLVRFGLSPDCI